MSNFPRKDKKDATGDLSSSANVIDLTRDDTVIDLTNDTDEEEDGTVGQEVPSQLDAPSQIDVPSLPITFEMIANPRPPDWLTNLMLPCVTDGNHKKRIERKKH